MACASGRVSADDAVIALQIKPGDTLVSGRWKSHRRVLDIHPLVLGAYHGASSVTYAATGSVPNDTTNSRCPGLSLAGCEEASRSNPVRALRIRVHDLERRVAQLEALLTAEAAE